MFDDRVYELYALREQAREAGTPFDAADVTPQERADLDRLIAELDPPAAGAAPDLPAPTARYRFDAFLARGGMGEVYRGEDTVLHRPVALKVLRRRLGVSAATFRAEAELVARLAHPGIVPVHDVGVLEDGRPFFAMKLVDGQTLEAALSESSARSPNLPRWLQWFEQVCQAVAYAHAQSPPLLHRDLKPQNVMVGAYGEVLVMDWGIARVIGPSAVDSVPIAPVRPSSESTVDDSRGGTPEETATGVAKGTVAYMAPEQARGERGRIGPTADVFGLGGILCRMLTGKATFAGDSSWERAIAGDVSDAHARLNECGADANLVAVAKRCLSSDPAGRYPHAGEVAAAVQGYLASVQEKLKRAEVEQARAETKAEGERRRRRVLAALALCVVALVGVGVGGAWYSDAQRTKRQAAENTQRERAVLVTESAIAQLPELWKRFLWQRGDQILAEAEGVLGEEGDPELRRRLAAAREDTRFLAELDRIQMEFVATEGGRLDVQYAHVFRRRGYDMDSADEVGLAGRLAADPLRRQIIDAVDAWCAKETDFHRHGQLRRLATRVGGGEWRALLEEQHPDRPTLERVAVSLRTAEASPAIFYDVGKGLEEAGGAGFELIEFGRRRFADNFWIHIWIGMLLIESEQEEGRANRHALAETAFRAALALRPDSADLHSHIATMLEKQGKRDEAMEEYERAIALEADCERAHFNVALLHRELKDYSRAELHARKALAINPVSYRGWELLSAVLLDRNDLPSAIAAQREAVERTRYFARAKTLNQLGIMHWTAEGKTAAMAAWKEAIHWNPNLPDPHQLLGRAHSLRGEHRRAIELLDRAVALDRKGAAAWHNLASARQAAGLLDSAKAAATTSVALAPELADARHVLGRIEVERGEYEAAARSFESGGRLAPNDARMFADLGLAREESGDFAGAATAFKEAASIESLPGLDEHVKRVERKVKLLRRIGDHRRGGDLPYEKEEEADVLTICATPAQREYALGFALLGDPASVERRLTPEFARLAAVIVVQLASGNDRGGAAVGFEECCRLMDWARRWLTSSLEGMRESPDLKWLRRCRHNPAFAPVREEACLEAMPDLDRQAWRRFWINLDRTIEAAQHDPSARLFPLLHLQGVL